MDEEKEKIPIAIIYKQGKNITIKLDGEANAYELFAFLTIYLKVLGKKLIAGMK